MTCAGEDHRAARQLLPPDRVPDEQLEGGGGVDEAAVDVLDHAAAAKTVVDLVKEHEVEIRLIIY